MLENMATHVTENDVRLLRFLLGHQDDAAPDALNTIAKMGLVDRYYTNFNTTTVLAISTTYGLSKTGKQDNQEALALFASLH